MGSFVWDDQEHYQDDLSTQSTLSEKEMQLSNFLSGSLFVILHVLKLLRENREQFWNRFLCMLSPTRQAKWNALQRFIFLHSSRKETQLSMVRFYLYHDITKRIRDSVFYWKHIIFSLWLPTYWPMDLGFGQIVCYWVIKDHLYGKG